MHPEHVAVVNTVGFHTEVYCAVIWAFQKCGAKTTAFVDLESTSGAQHVIRDWCGPVALHTAIKHLMILVHGNFSLLK